MKIKIVNKKELIISKSKNKDILDLGCVEHDLFVNKLKRGLWIHENLKQVANSLMGVDILTDKIKILNKKGYNIIYGDVERLTDAKELKNKTFDIVIAGDLIEHLFNPGLFLESVKPFLKSSGELIITTPNCFSLQYVLPFIFNNNEKSREDHTCWYSKKTLYQLLEMKGYRVTEFYYRTDLKINGIRPFFRVLLRKKFPRFSEGLIVVAKLDYKMY